MNALPTPTAVKIAKVLPLLGSPVDGEILAAADAIARLLASVGSDWAGLAGAILTPVAQWSDQTPAERLRSIERLLQSSTLSMEERGTVELVRRKLLSSGRGAAVTADEISTLNALLAQRPGDRRPT